MMKKSFKTKLNIKSSKSLALFKRMSGVYRKIYNLSMEAQEYRVLVAHQNTSFYFMNAKDLTKVILTSYKEESFSYLKQFDNGIIRAAVQDASDAFTKHFTKYLNRTDVSGLTPYLSRKKGNPYFRTTGKVRVFYDYITIPKFGKVKLYEKGYIPQGERYSNITFTYDGNDWWISLDVSLKEEPIEKNTNESFFLDFDKKGNLLINGKKEYSNVVFSKNYQKTLKAYKGLKRKLKRQTLQNKVESATKTKLVNVTTRNMLKTQKKIAKKLNKLDSIKKDFFKKVAHKLVILKPEKVYVYSNQVLRNIKDFFLTRFYRESSTKEFFNILLRAFQNTGTLIERIPLAIA